MSDIRRTLKALAVLYLLLAINSILSVKLIPAVFPFDHISSIYLLFLSIWLILRYYMRVAEQNGIKTMIMWISGMIFLLILFRCVKYSIFGSVFFLGRYTWYLYYIPILMIPLFLFYISCYLFTVDGCEVKRRWGWVAVISICLILLVLSNDLHQQVFRFHPGFMDWDTEYSYGWGFIIINLWEYLLYIVALAVMFVKCSIANIRDRAWVILIPFVLGVGMILLLITGYMPKMHGSDIIKYPEALCFMVAGILECCIRLGLIPTNENYSELMKLTSVPVYITDYDRNIIYRSDAAGDMPKEQFLAPDNTRIGEHTILKSMSVPGGYGFWQIDVSALDRVSDNLAEVRESLSEETELIRLQNDLKEKQAKTEQRNALYDDIIKATQVQTEAISYLAGLAMNMTDTVRKDEYRRHILLLGVYIKRYANLRLLSSQDNEISIGDLGLSVAEVFRYLNLYGIPGELINMADGRVSADKVLAVFHTFGSLIEDHLSELSGVYANFSIQKSGFVFKLTLEDIRTDSSEYIVEKLAATGIRTFFEIEDNVGYYSFAFGEGGEKHDHVL